VSQEPLPPFLGVKPTNGLTQNMAGSFIIHKTHMAGPCEAFIGCKMATVHSQYRYCMFSMTISFHSSCISLHFTTAVQNWPPGALHVRSTLMFELVNTTNPTPCNIASFHLPKPLFSKLPSCTSTSKVRDPSIPTNRVSLPTWSSTNQTPSHSSMSIMRDPSTRPNSEEMPSSSHIKYTASAIRTAAGKLEQRRREHGPAP
jgi:hypothetical protein